MTAFKQNSFSVCTFTFFVFLYYKSKSYLTEGLFWMLQIFRFSVRFLKLKVQILPQTDRWNVKVKSSLKFRYQNQIHCTKTMKFSIEDFFSKCDRIRSKLKKSTEEILSGKFDFWRSDHPFLGIMHWYVYKIFWKTNISYSLICTVSQFNKIHRSNL